MLRDGRSEQTLLLCYLGIECGIRISEELGVPPETHWLRRRDDLAALIRFGVLNQETPWVLDARLPDWMHEILPESHETWRRYRNTSRVVPRLWDARVGRDGNVRLLGDAPPAGEVKPSHWDARQAVAVLITAASLYETER